jgi:iron complex transport system ATP-binding protein
MNSLLRFDGVGFRFGSRSVLEGLSFEIAPGTCNALIGPNGVGKTTLLRLASGSLTASTGEVTVSGTPIAKVHRRQRAQLVALVPQQLDVPFDFSVQQIVEQGRTPYLGLLRGPGREDRAAVDRALELADVSGLRHRVFNELSGGERQRVKIALGLAQQPELLLLDEPTQNLDIGRQVELIDLLHYLRLTGLTILASIHDLHLVPQNFDCVHLLGPRHTHRSGTPDEVLTTPMLAEAFHCRPGRHPLLVPAALKSGQKMSAVRG